MGVARLQTKHASSISKVHDLSQTWQTVSSMVELIKYQFSQKIPLDSEGFLKPGHIILYVIFTLLST